MSVSPRITIVFPKPPRALHPNSRSHWRTVAKHKKPYRRACFFLAMKAVEAIVPPKWEKARWSAVFFVRDRRGLKQDEDNANSSLKNCLDALQDAGIVKNDRGLVRDSLKFEVDPARAGTVEIEIWQA